MTRYLLLMLAFSMTLAAQNNAPNVGDADKFVRDAERDLSNLGLKLQRAARVQENFVTQDTEQIAADANDHFTAAATLHRETWQARRNDQQKPEVLELDDAQCTVIRQSVVP